MPPVHKSLNMDQLRKLVSDLQLKKVKKIKDGTEKVYCVGTRNKHTLKNVKFYSVDSSGKSKDRLTIMVNGECSGTKNAKNGNKPYQTTSIIANVPKSGHKESKTVRKNSKKRRSKSRKGSRSRSKKR